MATIIYSTKYNERALGQESTITGESHIVGETGPFSTQSGYILLDEVPLQESPSTVIIAGYNEITVGTPLTGEFLVDYDTGRVQFAVAEDGNTVSVDYKGRGTVIFAEHVNDVQTPVALAINTDGTIANFKVVPSSISNNASHDFTFPNNVVITGDLTVNGTTTTINTTVLTVEDNIVELNRNVVGAPTLDGGLMINRGSSPDVFVLWNETSDAWEFRGSAGSALLQALDTGDVLVQGKLGLSATTPVATLHNPGSTILGISSVTNPASITVANVNNLSGLDVTTTGAVVLTLPSPTSVTSGRFFTVVHASGSTGTLSVDGKSISVGSGATFVWNGTTWNIVGSSTASAIEVLASDPGSPYVGQVWVNTVDQQVKAYNGSIIVILG